MGKDLLGSLYDDLYGGGSRRDGGSDNPGKKTGKREDGDASRPGRKYIPIRTDEIRDAEKQSSDTIRTTEETLKSARDALDEARRLFGTPGDLSGLRDGDTIGPDGIPGTPGGGTGGFPGTPGSGSPASFEGAAPAEPEPETDPMEDLEALIGLSTIKHDVKELMDFVKVQKMRSEEGLKSVPTSLHLVFTGNPGTGKTTVARIIGRLYKQIGVLSKGQLIEVDRSGLVAGFVGQTAIKTQEKIQEAMGGVLFIDEAYALAGGDQDSFGQEAINTVLKAMEDHRKDFVVIVAGYTEPMENFINSNPGLKSRFNKYIEFPDYTMDELEAIFRMNCRKYDYEIDDDVMTQVRGMIATRKLVSLENFANAREVRNLFEEVITNQARRVAAMESPTHEDMVRILLDDLVEESDAPAGDDAGKPGGAEAPAGDTAGEPVDTEAPAEDTAPEPGDTEVPAGDTAGEPKGTDPEPDHTPEEAGVPESGDRPEVRDTPADEPDTP